MGIILFNIFHILIILINFLGACFRPLMGIILFNGNEFTKVMPMSL